MNGSRKLPVAILRQQLRLESDNRILAEVRSDIWPRKGSRARIVTAHELWTWLEMREQHFVMLTHRGIAGGSMRIKLSALGGD